MRFPGGRELSDGRLIGVCPGLAKKRSFFFDKNFSFWTRQASTLEGELVRERSAISHEKRDKLLLTLTVSVAERWVDGRIPC